MNIIIIAHFTSFTTTQRETLNTYCRIFLTFPSIINQTKKLSIQVNNKLQLLSWQQITALLEYCLQKYNIYLQYWILTWPSELKLIISTFTLSIPWNFYKKKVLKLFYFHKTQVCTLVCVVQYDIGCFIYNNKK